MAISKIPAEGLESGNKINLSNVNAAAPNIVPPVNFFNDLGTGIFSPESGVVGVASNGVEILRFTPTGISANGSTYGGQNPDFAGTNVVLYVNIGDKNCSDSVLNTGGNLNAPFKSIERALIEVARRSYVAGVNNDKNNGYTIMVYPGEYLVDNRPGLKTATQIANIVNLETELYKFNPVGGGVIVPRGTSIIAIDPRKTVIRPKYVPDPTVVIPGVMYDGAKMLDRNRGYIIEQTYLQILQDYPSIVNINQTCKRDLGLILTAIGEDLKNGGNTNSFIAGETYINGTSVVYLSSSEVLVTTAAIQKLKQLSIATVLNNWTSVVELTVNKTINRYVPVVNVDYSSNGDCSSVASAIDSLATIIAGIITDPVGYSSTYTKTTGTYDSTPIFKVTGSTYFSSLTFSDAKQTPYKAVSYTGDTPAFIIANNAQYSHHKLVAFGFAEQRNSYGELTDYYKKINAWDLIVDGGGVREVLVDEYTIVSKLSSPNSVKGASPYIFGCAVRSVYGLNGLLVDGKKVANDSFKSFVLAQFTTISLQLDPNAFVSDPGDAIDSTTYAPNYKHYAYKVINNAYAQIVSCFAIGQAQQFVTESGGEVSINNSTSNFGGVSLYSSGNSPKALKQDIGHNILKVIPPKLIGQDIKRIVVGGLNTTNTNLFQLNINNLNDNNGNITFPLNSYCYVAVPNPQNPSQILKLQVKLNAVGTSSGNFSVYDYGDLTIANTISFYMFCVGDYRFESSWYDPNDPRPVGEQAARESDRRRAEINNIDVFVERLVDNRTLDEKNYSFLVVSPPNTRIPTNNYIVSQSAVDNNTSVNKYFVTNIASVNATDVNNNYTTQGNLTTLKILRANRISTLNIQYPDNIDDLNSTRTYSLLVNNLDPRLYTDTTAVSVDFNNVSYLSAKQLFTDFGYSAGDINILLLPNSGATLLTRVTNLISNNNTNSTLTGSSIKFNMLKPSILRCSNHTWEYVGYKNYVTALPQLQVNILSTAAKYKAIQTSINGGVVYATGMDEVGNLYQGNNVINLADNSTSSIRFDGVSNLINNSSANKYFTDIIVNNTAKINIASINTLTSTLLQFNSSSALKINLGGVVSDLIDTNIPVGLRATADKYGLVRKATNNELINLIGGGFVTPPDLSNYVNKTGNQTISGVKSFASPISIPNGVANGDAVNLSQVASLMSTFEISNFVFPTSLYGNMYINFGRILPATGYDGTSSFANPKFTNPPIVVITEISQNNDNIVSISNVTKTGFSWHGRTLSNAQLLAEFYYIAIGN